jgi:uncharacterized protein (TIGR02996 family)
VTAVAALDDLLAAIVANPDADDLRLVYADALSARGDPRGEFIALQCALARGSLDRAAARAARIREHELLAAHGAQWRGARPFVCVVRFHRGFIGEVRLGASDLLDRADDLRALAPVVDTLHVCNIAWDHGLEQLEPLLELPVVDRLRGLFLHDLGGDVQGAPNLGDDAVRILIDRAPRLARLTDVGLDCVTDVAPLLRLPELAALESFAVWESDARVASVVLDAALPRLNQLTIDTSLGADELAKVVAHPRLHQLEAIWLRGDASRIRRDSPSASRIRRLVLDITHADRLAVLSALGLGELRELSVRGDVDRAEALALVDWAEARRLDVLDLSTCEEIRGIDAELEPRFGGFLKLPGALARIRWNFDIDDDQLALAGRMR